MAKSQAIRKPLRKPPGNSIRNPAMGSTRIAFATGMLLGIIIACAGFLLWPKVAEAPPNLQAVEDMAGQASQRVTESIDWSFYDLFPKAEVATVGGYQQPMAAEREPNREYFLQVGSFPRLDDADERRAELLLLGLSPSVENKMIEQRTWHRIMLGPFESDVELNRVQAILAANDFESMPIAKAKEG